MSFFVRPVTSRRDLKRFIAYPYSFYRSNPFWVPPLRMDQATVLNPRKNPFFEHGKVQGFLAEDASGRIIGRIAGIVNGMHLKKYADGNGFFGFFECEERYPIAQALLEAAQTWLTEQGLNGMRGPANPSMNDVAGLLVDGFDRYPTLMMPYNPPYHEEFLLRYGFERAMTMYAYYIHYKYRKDLHRIERGVNLVHRRYPDLKLRTLDMSRFDAEAKAVLDIYNDAWSENWGHVPMTDHEFKHLAKDLKQIVDPNIVYILEKADAPIGFSISLPNLNEALRHIKGGRLFPLGLPHLLLRSKLGGIRELRTLLMGVRKVYQGKGFDTILNHAILTGGPANGYPASEMSWVLASNKAMVNAAESIGGVKDKTYAMFEKQW